MSGNTGRSSRVTGPRSALSDYLWANNIRASEITRNVRLRLEESRVLVQDALQEIAATDAADTPIEREDNPRMKEAIAKIRAAKAGAAKKRKRGGGGGGEDDDDDDGDGSDADGDLSGLFKLASDPIPGQTNNCVVCSNRFTVTPYTHALPNHVKTTGNPGLLCNPCGKKYAKAKIPPKKKTAAARKVQGGVGRRRVVQKHILDGGVSGPKPLTVLCLETLAKNIDLAESLGEMPDHQVDRIARIMSKRRAINARTLQLFVRPATEKLAIYDCAYIGEEAMLSFLQTCRNLKLLKLKNAIQFKDGVLNYLIGRDHALEHFYLHGANLVTDPVWEQFFIAKGAHLRSLRVYHTDRYFGDETLEVVLRHCPALTRLKLYGNQQVTARGVASLAGLAGLRHLGLRLAHPIDSKTLASTITVLGKDLETLSLRVVPDAQDEVLLAIHDNCRSLRKLQITDSMMMSDEGFERLFTDWPNVHLHRINFEKCRQIDAPGAEENESRVGHEVGVRDKGFLAMMKHSGKHLKSLNLHACRLITADGFHSVFDLETEYPDLQKLEISFCPAVDNMIMERIFVACPSLAHVNVFGCPKLRAGGNFQVPERINVVGLGF